MNDIKEEYMSMGFSEAKANEIASEFKERELLEILGDKVYEVLDFEHGLEDKEYKAICKKKYHKVGFSRLINILISHNVDINISLS